MAGKTGAVTLDANDISDATATGKTLLTAADPTAAKTALSLTKTDVSLGNVDNTSDANKPISTATATALSGKEPTLAAGTTAQYYRGDKTWQTLNQDAVPDGTINKAYTATDKTRLANTSGTNTGDQDLSGLVLKTTTVNGYALSGNVTLTKSDVGLSNVDNTSDATKNAATVTLTNKTLDGPALLNTSKVAQSGSIELYNTSDQVTNWEKLAIRFSSNNAEIRTLYNGTGGSRNLVMGSGGLAGESPGTNASQIVLRPSFAPFIELSRSSNLAGNLVAATGGMGGASVSQAAFAITPPITQSGTSSYAALLINPTETATGSGTKRLIDAQVGSATKFAVDNTGSAKIYQGSVEIHRFAESVSNTEYGYMRWNGSTFQFGASASGTGILRSVSIAAWSSSMTLNAVPVAYTSGTTQIKSTSGNAGSGILSVQGDQTAPSGLQVGVNVNPVINQTGTAGYTALMVNPTETATGSGSKLLIDAQVGGMSKFSVDNAGAVLLNGGVAAVDVSSTQTLTNKDLTSATNTFPTSLVTLTGTQTLTNKTLTNVFLNASLYNRISDTNGNRIIDLSPAASAVNYVQVANAATTAAPTISSTGSDTNVSLNLTTKGTGTVQANGKRVVTQVSVPATGTSTGAAGDIAYDSSYVYVCTATNTWVRAALSTW